MAKMGQSGSKLSAEKFNLPKQVNNEMDNDSVFVYKCFIWTGYSKQCKNEYSGTTTHLQQTQNLSPFKIDSSVFLQHQRLISVEIKQL